MRRDRVRPRIASAIVGVVAALAVAACDAQPSEPRPSAASAQALTEREKDLLHDAEQQLTRSCMAARGFRMWPVPRRSLPEDRDFPYAIDDVRWAARHGYGSDMQARREQVRAADPNRRYFERLGTADRQRALAAYHGDQSADRLEVRDPNGMTVGRIADGCVAEAEERLYGDLSAWFRADVITGAFPALRQQQVTADDEFKAVVRKWSACMRERGLQYRDPYQARASFLDTTAATRTTNRHRQEVRTAVAEAECARDVGLTATARRLDQHYDARLRDQYRDEVRTRLRLERAALARARTILPNDRPRSDQ
ncbi:putative secreted protein [Streptomyces davaonensis JCM 4913]|uniref:Putative secreted protein n=1 Tax=Streptomyces davaonensis (strain DSM 101723 / JCM 4913 / KCC S-0913 / 768) TaxID=1214101 RepID=K4R245_STRDJ|nr:hypothetical protein [Streptomyces davaonensis]CCK30316.1 putative secreted protein [Streptomyces davaonensis JCM 4913]